jgi:hypothetical protein
VRITRPRLRGVRVDIPLKTVVNAVGRYGTNIAISMRVVSEGPPSAYALTWEYGNVHQTKAGPKTMLSYDIETGRRIWLTIQSPVGYIRIWIPLFRAIIQDEIAVVQWGQKDTKKQLMRAMQAIGEQLVSRLQQYVPVDTGDLKKSIKLRKPHEVPPTELFSDGRRFGG